ncbi:hypothetical protein [Streptomyces xanthophaeus]|uniref:hypothetical protein n=1 Tax=Streptomyces xanthophaeus TaxID=67385 RepID=UPI00371AF02F
MDGPDRHDVVVEALAASNDGRHGVLHGLDARSGALTTHPGDGEPPAGVRGRTGRSGAYDAVYDNVGAR